MKKNRVRLTESQLHRVINESVKQVLSELDWKTYANAARQRKNQGNVNNSKELKKASARAFNKQYPSINTTINAKYGLDNPALELVDPYGYPHHDDPVPYLRDRIKHSGYNDGIERTDYETYSNAREDMENYLGGNYEYQKGKGWQLKDNMDESIRRAIRKVLR